MKKLLSIIFLFPCLSMANSGGEDCLKIDDKDKRLECYDTYFSNKAKIPTTNNNINSSEKPTKWIQQFKENKMTGVTTQLVAIASDNTHSFDFPYQGDQDATIRIKNKVEQIKHQLEKSKKN